MGPTHQYKKKKEEGKKNTITQPSDIPRRNNCPR